MSRPWKHPKSGVYYLRRRVPADLVELVGTRLVKFSLRTKDCVEAKRLHMEALQQLQREWDSLRAGPKPLTHKQIIALAGLAYRHLIELTDEWPGSPDIWEAVLARNDNEAAAEHLTLGHPGLD